MSGRTLDTATPIYAARQQENADQNQAIRNAQASQDLLQKHFQMMDDREKSRLSSTIVGAVQLKQFLDNNDTKGAEEFLLRRRQMLHNRLAAGENVDTQETDYALQALQSGNLQELQRGVNGLIAAGQVYGIVRNPSQDQPANVREWEYYNKLSPEQQQQYRGLTKPTPQQNPFLAQFSAVKAAHPDWTDAQAQDYVYTRGQVGKGTTFDDSGQVVNQPGAVAAASERAGTTKFSERSGATAGAQVTKNDETLGTLQTMQNAIQNAKAQLQRVSMTGPVLGRTAEAARDPEYVNLQRNINEITLLAKDLYNLGSGQGFTDADRDFLQELAGGKYNRAESIGYALDQMQNALQRRAQYLQRQSQQYQQRYNPSQNPSAGIQLDAPSTASEIKFLGFE
jgi:hypothetical protein